MNSTLYDLWKPRRRIEAQFHQALNKIVRRINWLVKDIDDPAELEKALIDMAKSKLFQKAAEAAALKMVTGLFADHGRTWRQAAQVNSQGRRIYEALQRELQGATGKRVRELVQENAALIKTLPQDLAQKVASYVEKETFKGRRASEIEKEIQLLFPHHTTARAKLIARTQVAMVHTDLIKSRSEQFGWQYYVWRAVGGNRGDGRTRPAHRKMSGIICAWNDPPAPEDLFPTFTQQGLPYRNTLGHYHPGQCPNCRCYPEVILDIDLLQWPMRFHKNGRILMINKGQFLKLAGR